MVGNRLANVGPMPSTVPLHAGTPHARIANDLAMFQKMTLSLPAHDQRDDETTEEESAQGIEYRQIIVVAEDVDANSDQRC